MKEGEKRREEWSKKIGEQVDGVVKGLPSVSKPHFLFGAASLLLAFADII